MRNCRMRRGRGGFTLMELIFTVAILLMVSLVGLPAFLLWIERSRTIGIVRSTATRMQLARQEAITMQLPVVVQPDLAKEEIVVFANVDNDTGFTFNPDDSLPFKTADYEMARIRLPTKYDVHFWSPADKDPNGKNVIDGLTTTNAGENAFVFLPDGSVMDPGAIRVADERGNFFEIRVEPRATARVQILKYYKDPPWGDPDGFFPRGRHPTEEVPMWKWY